MPRRGYQQQLDDLRDDVLYMSEVVLERLRMGLDALNRKDPDLAWSIIEGDDEVNDLYLDLESDCIDLFALQQPVAGDLRFIAASFKIITDLERIADLATNLAEYSLVADREGFPDVDVQSIGARAHDMVEAAMDAYASEDAAASRDVDDQDDELDRLCERASETVVRDLLERQLDAGEDVEDLMGDVSRLLLTVRDLERVGDHAVNVAARALYMAENDASLIY
ncbi:phosphate transport system regulatory protein PhoU [Halobacteriales archaeon QH_6_64_20]|nr:MAG: phosphate transport system regulatory protein PhoU [Halobacteriales archaeon QH_6_64_20]